MQTGVAPTIDADDRRVDHGVVHGKQVIGREIRMLEFVDALRHAGDLAGEILLGELLDETDTRNTPAQRRLIGCETMPVRREDTETGDNDAMSGTTIGHV